MQIRKLATEPTQFRLAISLHGATDEVRSQIMPVNRKDNLDALLEACDFYVAQKKRLMFEYILIAGVNDSDEQAQKLARHALRLSAKINLIPYNTVEGLPWSRPSRNRQETFLRILRHHGAVAKAQQPAQDRLGVLDEARRIGGHAGLYDSRRDRGNPPHRGATSAPGRPARHRSAVGRVEGSRCSGLATS